MEREQFWKLIEQSRQDVDECDEQAEKLTELLSELEPKEIMEFEAHLDQCVSASYRWDLWAIGYIVNGGCSDDGFLYFRGWLISQGREYFEAALKDPQRAADNARVGDDEWNECEAILYTPSEAHEIKTGKEMPYDEVPYTDEPYDASLPVSKKTGPAGKEWNEDDLEEMYPEICKRFR